MSAPAEPVIWVVSASRHPENERMTECYATKSDALRAADRLTRRLGRDHHAVARPAHHREFAHAPAPAGVLTPTPPAGARRSGPGGEPARNPDAPAAYVSATDWRAQGLVRDPATGLVHNPRAPITWGVLRAPRVSPGCTVLTPDDEAAVAAACARRRAADAAGVITEPSMGLCAALDGVGYGKNGQGRWAVILPG